MHSKIGSEMSRYSLPKAHRSIEIPLFLGFPTIAFQQMPLVTSQTNLIYLALSHLFRCPKTVLIKSLGAPKRILWELLPLSKPQKETNEVKDLPLFGIPRDAGSLGCLIRLPINRLLEHRRIHCIPSNPFFWVPKISRIPINPFMEFLWIP